MRISSMAPACRDARFCVSRPAMPLLVHHLIALFNRDLPPCETQNLASLLWQDASVSVIFMCISLMASACRDAKFCVSRSIMPLLVHHLIALFNWAYLLVRRKILRLYFCQPLLQHCCRHLAFSFFPVQTATSSIKQNTIRLTAAQNKNGSMMTGPGLIQPSVSAPPPCLHRSGLSRTGAPRQTFRA